MKKIALIVFLPIFLLGASHKTTASKKKTKVPTAQKVVKTDVEPEILKPETTSIGFVIGTRLGAKVDFPLDSALGVGLFYNTNFNLFSSNASTASNIGYGLMGTFRLPLDSWIKNLSLTLGVGYGLVRLTDNANSSNYDVTFFPYSAYLGYRLNNHSKVILGVDQSIGCAGYMYAF